MTGAETLAETTGRGASALIVNYHYCHPRSDPLLAGVGSVTPEQFSRQLETIGRNFDTVTAEAFVQGLWREATNAQAVAMVTFDDGLKSIAEHALPELRRRGHSAIVFCCSLPILEKRVVDVHKIHLLQCRLGPAKFQTLFLAVLEELCGGWEREDATRLGLAPMYRYDGEAARQFKFFLNVELPYRHLTRVLDLLFETHIGAQADVVDDLYMSLDDMKRCVEQGFMIGVHTHQHRMLSRLSIAEQTNEIETPARVFAEQLGKDSLVLSYPYGIEGSWNRTTEQLLLKNNFAAAFTLERRNYDPAIDINRYRIPRYDINDVCLADGRLAQGVVRRPNAPTPVA